MSEPTNQRSMGRDVFGLALMVLAVFSGVSVFMALGERPLEAHGTTAVFLAMVDTLGPIASFVLSLGLLLVGLMLWIKGISSSVLRHLFGVLITTVTVSILVGAVSADLGGSVGWIGAMVTRNLTMFVGVPTGLAFVLLPAWFLWLRPAEKLAAREESQTLAPRVATTSDSEGVSAAEAEALLPRPIVPAARTTPLAPAPRAAAPATAPVSATKPAPLPSAPRTPPTSPYPTDVRIHGGVPDGARPLENSYGRHEPQSAHHDVAVQREPARQSGNGEHGRAGAPVAPVEVTAAVERPADPHRVAAERHSEQHTQRASALAPQAELASQAAPAPLVVDAAAEPYLRTPPAPSWEQPSLFEEPVDAYGTPLTLVAELRKHNAESLPAVDEFAGDELALVSTEAAPAPLLESAPTPEPAAHTALNLDSEGFDTLDHEERGAEVTAALSLDDLGDLEDEADLASVKPLVSAVPQAQSEAAVTAEVERHVFAPSLFDKPIDVARDEADELDEDEGFEDEAELAGIALDDADDDEEDSEDDEEALAAEVVAPLERAMVEPELPFVAPQAAAAPVTPLVASVTPLLASMTPPVAQVTPLLASMTPLLASNALDEADADEAAAADARPELHVELDATEEPALDLPAVTRREVDESEELDATDEPVVVLTPPSASGAKARSKIHVSPDSYKSGCLFIERQRVAVSMLQKEYAMDFKTATAVLDELQKVGLIGPYLGGQRRDILMTQDEWKEKVGVV